MRLSFGKLPTAKVAVLSAIFRHTTEIYDGKTEAIFRQLPTDLFALNEAIFRQAADKYLGLSFGYLSANRKNRAHTDFSLMISEFSYDGLG